MAVGARRIRAQGANREYTGDMTNSSFAAQVGCHHTMASRLRNGKRLPSLSMFATICETFDLDTDDALSAYKQGPDAFGAFLRATVFSRIPSAAAT